MGPNARTVKVPGGHQRQEETGYCGASLRLAEKRRHCRQIMSPLALLSAAIFFHSRYDSPKDDLMYTLAIKVGVCWKLSASSPETYQCTYALLHTLDSLFMCLYNVFEA